MQFCTIFLWLTYLSTTQDKHNINKIMQKICWSTFSQTDWLITGLLSSFISKLATYNINLRTQGPISQILLCMILPIAIHFCGIWLKLHGHDHHQILYSIHIVTSTTFGYVRTRLNFSKISFCNLNKNVLQFEKFKQLPDRWWSLIITI